jgi:hypothetical protein
MNARLHAHAAGLGRHRKTVTVRTIVILLGLFASSAIWSLASLHPEGVRLDTLISRQAIAADLLQGEFIDGVRPYRGEGTAIVADAQDGGFEVRFTDFSVSQGPDLHVWLVAHPDPRNSRHVRISETLPLGSLKATSGDQAYSIPAGTDFSKYQSVVIWCKVVNGLFAAAVLR